MTRLLVPLMAFLIFTQETSAFVTSYALNGQPTRWNLVSPQFTHPNVVNRTTKAIRYFLGAETYSATNPGAVHQALRNCFLQWQSVPGTILKFEEGGILPGQLDVNIGDNTNVVFWATTTTLVNNQMDDIRFATGVTFFSTFADNSIKEADIVMNDHDYEWFSDYNNPPTFGNAFFVESVALHEIGHFVGLDHSPFGAATMYARGGLANGGVFVQGELSQDEIAAAQSIYGTAATTASQGRLTGQVTIDNKAVFGAVVAIENAAGIMAGGTVTLTNGQFELPALPPGNYLARVSPLDPMNGNGNDQLTTGLDIEPRFELAETDFLPSESKPVSIIANKTTVQNFPVVRGAPAFRITRLRPASTNPAALALVSAGGILSVGQSNQFLGVYSPNLPTANATLTITGDGLTLGGAIFTPNAFSGFNLVSVEVSVAATATPGLRSFILRQGDQIAYAEGLIKIRPAFPDINRDGFDDRFQREYFLTPYAATAAANADPDGDGFSNASENIAGTSPVDALSRLRFESITWTSSGATLRWFSRSGRNYRLTSQSVGQTGAEWELVAEVSGNGAVTEYVDAGGWLPEARIYRLVAVP